MAHGGGRRVAGAGRASGATIFFVTHDLEEAIYLGDRVIGLRAVTVQVEPPLLRA